MNDTKHFRKTLLLDIGVAVAIIIPLFIGVFLLRGAIDRAVTETVQARAEIAKHTADLNALVTLRSQKQRFGDAYLNVLHTIVPEKDRLINISQEFQSLASQYGLDFGFSFLGESAEEGRLGSVEFAINVGGDTLEDVVTFLEEIRDFRYLTTIHGLTITQKDDIMQGVIRGKVYYRQTL